MFVCQKKCYVGQKLYAVGETISDGAAVNLGSSKVYFRKVGKGEAVKTEKPKSYSPFETPLPTHASDIFAEGEGDDSAGKNNK